jgi:hypothetical protein
VLLDEGKEQKDLCTITPSMLQESCKKEAHPTKGLSQSRRLCLLSGRPPHQKKKKKYEQEDRRWRGKEAGLEGGLVEEHHVHQGELDVVKVRAKKEREREKSELDPQKNAMNSLSTSRFQDLCWLIEERSSHKVHCVSLHRVCSNARTCETKQHLRGWSSKNKKKKKKKKKEEPRAGQKAEV